MPGPAYALVAPVLIEHFPHVYAETCGLSHDDANTVLLHRFGVILPGIVSLPKDALQVSLAIKRIRRAAHALDKD